jgi:hypothetical protein
MSAGSVFGLKSRVIDSEMLILLQAGVVQHAPGRTKCAVKAVSVVLIPRMWRS